MNKAMRKVKRLAGGLANPRLLAVVACCLALFALLVGLIDYTNNPEQEGVFTTGAGRTATIVIAAHNSHPQSKAQADFVADGVDDQVEIQAAIDALPAVGGKVLLMEGTFHVGGTSPIISLRSNLTLAGMGDFSVIRLKDGTVPHGGLPKFPIIEGRGTAATPIINIRIENFAIDGNHGKQVANAYPLPIQLNHSTRFHIEGMYIFDTYTAIEPNHSSYGIISNNFIRDVIIGDGIGPNHSSYLIITRNILENVAEGIDLDSDTNNSIVFNNTLRATTRAIMGVMVTDSSYNMIMNNRIEGHPTLISGFGFNIGVWLRLRTQADTTMHNVVEGNSIRIMTEGMRVDGTGHILQGNFIEDITGAGIIITARFGTGQRVMVIQNQLRNIGTHGIVLGEFSRDVVVRGNLLTNIGIRTHHAYSAIIIISGGQRIHVIDNIISSEEPTNRMSIGIRTLTIPDTAPPTGRIERNNLKHSGAVNAIVNHWSDTLIMSEAMSKSFMDVLAASTTHVVTATQSLVTVPAANITSPDVPHNISVTQAGTGTPVAGNATVTGIDDRGRTISEIIAMPATNTTVFGSKAFATVTEIVGFDAGAGQTLSVGISNKIGLSVDGSNFDGVFRVARNGVVEPVGAVDLINGMVDLGTITTGDDFLIHYRVNLNVIR